MNRRAGQRSILTSFLGVSLLLHLQVILIAVAVISMRPQGCATAPDLLLDPIEVALVPSESELEARQRALQEERQQEQREERKPAGEVVELPAPREERRPKDAKYVSEYDTTVRRETKAAATRRTGGARARPGRRAARRPLRGSARSQPRAELPGALAMRTRPQVPRTSLPPQPDGQQSSAPTAAPQPGAAAERLVPGALQPTHQELQRAIASGGRLDALMGVEEGSETLLNSRRWRFASFFNRMKRQVAQNWHPDREYRRRDPGGNVYGFKDRLTIIHVKLTPAGKLEAMQLEKPSGLGFLDDEAMNAFRLAQPFPNPPKGLVDETSGLISFRFGFLFEISTSPNYRILRFGQ